MAGMRRQGISRLALWRDAGAWRRRAMLGSSRKSSQCERAHGGRWASSIAALSRRFGMWICAGVLLMGYGEEAPASDNWAQLCDREDCERYPEGFATVKAGESFLYFPLMKIPTLSTGSGWYQQEKDTQWPLRSVTEETNMVLMYHNYPNELLKRLNLLPQWPGRIDSPAEIAIFLVKKNNDRFWVGEGGRTWVSRPDKKVWVDFLAGGKDASVSLNNDFLIVFQSGEIKQRPTFKTNYRDFAIYSKRPLLQGKHVVFLCRDECVLFTVSEGENQKDVHLEYSFGPMFRYGRLNHAPRFIDEKIKDVIISAVACDSDNPLVGCDDMGEKLKDMPKALKILDEMIERIKTPKRSARREGGMHKRSGSASDRAARLAAIVALRDERQGI